MVFTPDRKQVDEISFAINNVFSAWAAFVTVIICTTILVVQLNSKTKWRSKNVKQATQAENISSRDRKLIKMVVTVSGIFIVLFIPGTVSTSVMIFKPDYGISGKYNNLFFIVWSFFFLLEGVNSTVNIFAYLTMSSKYKAAFCELFCIVHKKGTQAE
ncbi:uncharacterized protein LOC106013629 [Aplysia californica]|uniref:Uncharacterized protein LOC106013629 n=1 Tax=Aplysia californica TaxID=6500 RepID=A0ABM1ACZ2_APLCA|nr:uncharacterized protein LOC106013629 [Aplysia californica]